MSKFMSVPTCARLRQLGLLLLFSLSGNTVWAITANQLDDFNDATSQGWTISNGTTDVFVAEHEGPTGENDHSLLMDTGFQGSGGRLIVLNNEQWTGDWTAEGITRVSLDVRNPNDFVLSLRLGISGPDAFGPGGVGDTHVTNAISIPADNAWHSVTFDVLSSDFTATSGYDPATALTDVLQFRILHNPDVSFIGEVVDGGFYLDNIEALTIPEPTTGILLGFVLMASLFASRRVRR
jgi:hypothetical protein